MKPEEIEDFIVQDGNEVTTDDIPMCKDWKTWMNLWITWVSSEGANNRLSYVFLKICRSTDHNYIRYKELIFKYVVLSNQFQFLYLDA